MKRILNIFCIITLAHCYLFSNELNTLFSIINYINNDYKSAIQSGKIVNQMEFNEQVDFSHKAHELLLKNKSSFNEKDLCTLITELNLLSSQIQNKSTVEEISLITNRISKVLLTNRILIQKPSSQVSLLKGSEVYKSNCTSCHGIDGKAETEISKYLNPKPRNLINYEFFETSSMLSIFNAVKYGIEGTSMLAHSKLTDEEIWNVSFYVKSLLFKELVNSNTFNVSKSEVYENFILKNNIYSLSGLALKDSLKNIGLTINELFSYISNRNDKTNNSKFVFLFKELTKEIGVIESNSLQFKVLDFYLNKIEPVEKILSSIDNELSTKIETNLFTLKSLLEQNKIQEAKLLSKDIILQLEKAENLINSNDSSALFTFFLSFFVIIREGLEALLIIVTILGLLNSIKKFELKKYIHIGWGIALIFGLISFAFIGELKSISPSNRELIEAFGSALAVFMLLYIGFWLHSKTDAKKWKEFVEDKVYKLINSKNIVGLSILAFIVVFREVIESVIFLSSISIDSNSSSNSPIYFGAISAIFLVFVISWILLKSTKRIPIFKLFKYSAFTIAIISVMLAGKSIAAFQESGLISYNSLNFNFDLPLIGLYSRIETILAQLVILAVTIILWNLKLSKR
jgi:high-affinity iron transporter